jgi:hypothetical protein
MGKRNLSTQMTPDPKAVGGYHQQTTGSDNARSYLWAARIVHVDVETMVCSIRLESGNGEYHDVPIPAPGGGGPRSWSGNMPESGSKVIIGWSKFGFRGFKPYIVEFLTSGIYLSRDYEPFSSVSPEESEQILSEHPEMEDDLGVNLKTVRLKNRKAYPGDWVASSASGADALLDRDAYLTNRAGNEFRLRDSDQTSVLQVLNEFRSNAAGYYKSGLVKRNAFSFLPDLYPLNEDRTIPDKISKDSPAYPILLSFGLIKDDGSKNFPDTIFYPHVVTADGQHVAYVTHGEQDTGFADTSYSYTEDRAELRHLSDGVMAVTEEGDGFQVDPPFPVFIEDVKGTVVGNDFHSESGRPLYKRILRMKIFSSVGQRTLSNGPMFEPVDMVQDLGIVDDVALARLFRVLSPNGSNQYAFGISKEGRVFLHVPKSRVGSTEDKGKSVDMSIAGLIKAIIGGDENSGNKSIDARLLGGIDLEVGRMNDGNSINLKLHGKVRVEHVGNDSSGLTKEEVIGGSTSRNVSASEFSSTGGSSVEDIGAEKAIQCSSLNHNIGPGGYKQLCSGDKNITILGKIQEQYAQLATSTWAIGKTSTILAGIDNKTILAGSKSTTVTAGSYSSLVGTGNFSSTVGAGAYSVSVGAGSFSATVGAGPLALSAAAGPLSLNSSTTNTVTAAVMNIFTAPVTKIGAVVVGCGVAGIPGPPGPHIDYITGLPIFGVPTLLVG